MPATTLPPARPAGVGRTPCVARVVPAVTLTSFPPGAFTAGAVTPPSRLVPALETEVMRRVIRAAEVAAGQAIAELNALGHHFVAEAGAPLCFVGPLPDGRTLRLEVNVAGSSPLRVLAPGELPAEYTRPTPCAPRKRSRRAAPPPSSAMR